MIRMIAVLLLCALAGFAQPARIVSTSPSITETLFALGAGPSVVGVSTYCRFPPQVRLLPKVGSFSKPNAEHIALLRPDLVILHRAGGDLANRLQALGIRTAEVEQGSLTQVYSSIRSIGDAIGRSRQAEELVGRLRSGIAVSAARHDSGARPSVLLIVGRDHDQLTGLVAAGDKTYLGELLAAAGGRNLMNGQYPHISLETVIRLDPDVLIDASGMGDEPNDTPEQRRRTIQPWVVRRELKAAREGRVSAALSETLVVPGPRVLEAVRILSDCLYLKGRR
jgi:iron complex transport system substrate-binding protein